MKNSVFDMDCKTAREFMLEGKNYFNCGLPPYFNIDKLLKQYKNILTESNISDFFEKKESKNIEPSSVPNINYTFQYNKTRESYRPITLIHPFLYVDLVNTITEKENWSIITERIKNIDKRINKKVKCKSYPFENDAKNQSDGKKYGLQFWEEIEQESIKLALKYNYVLKLDLSNFYGSIYTHSITWAIHGEDESKADRFSKTVGNLIDKSFQNMNYGETVGIPQGNVVSDIVSEILLRNIDELLYKKLEIAGITEYGILRFRDDYRIFTKTIDASNRIKKELVVILQRYKLSLGESKTVRSDDIIVSSIKPDKLYWIEHDPVVKLGWNKSLASLIGKRFYTAGLQKHLLTIKLLSDNYKNSSQLIGALSDFDNRIDSIGPEEIIKQVDVSVLAAIIVQIMFENPKATQRCVIVLSKLLTYFDADYFPHELDWDATIGTEDSKQDHIFKKLNYVSNIYQKYSEFTDNDYIEIWLQRLIVHSLSDNSSFVENYIANSKNGLVRLCNSALSGKQNLELFNQEWLQKRHRIDYKTFIDLDIIKTLEPVISSDEIRDFEYGEL